MSGDCLDFQLDEQQESAAKHVEGPLLIIAGPGSGKTRVIAAKVLNLARSGVPQDSVLCMTFTTKAAGEMRQRLEKEGVTDVKIGTFHSLAKEILEDNFVESGLERTTRIFKKTSQLVWCIKNTDRFGLDANRLAIGSNQIRVYTAALRAIASYKEEMITPAELQSHIDSTLDGLNGKDTKGRDVQEQLKYYHRLNEFNKIYRAYEDHRKERNLIDFDDMVAEAVRLLRRDPVILQGYRDRFRHILIDEFQDNNFSQMELVKLLAGSKNITAVGDDDQCIMGFQGAYRGIFREFEEAYAGLKKSRLVRNYRSTKNIVELARQLLAAVKNREKKRLYSDEEDGDPVSVVRTLTEAGQGEFVARTVRESVGQNLQRRDGTVRRITYGDIAVLSRSKAEGLQYVKSMRSLGIPATFAGEVNILANPAILDLLAFLRMADSPTTSGMEIFKLLKNHGISEQNIAVLTREAHMRAMRAHAGEQDFVLDTVRKHGNFAVTQKSEIAELVGQIDRVIDLAGSATISELVYEIMFGVSDLYKRSVDSDGERDRRNILLLNKFYEIAQEFQDIYPTSPLSEFLEHVRITGEFDIEIEDMASEDAVSVMTMHKSKGKEFPIVFVTDLVMGRFPVKWRDRLFDVPRDLLRGADRIADTEELHTEEERRLFYVSVTRAMNRLFLLYPRRYTDKVSENKPSQFLEELDYENNPRVRVTDFEESGEPYAVHGDAIERARSRLQAEAVRAVNQMHLTTAVHRIVELAGMRHREKHGSLGGFVPGDVLKIDVDDLDLSPEMPGARRQLINMDTFTLSPSSIAAFEDCPLKFKYQKILRVPQKASASLDLGSVIHDVVRVMAEMKTRGEAPTRERGMEILRDRWIFRSYPSRADEGKAMGRAEQMIEAYLRWDAKTQNEVVGTEVPFEVKIGGITFTGRIDRLERNPDGKYEVVDFKSGSSAKSKDKARADHQLNIYAKAVEKIMGALPAKASLFYLEKDRMVEYDITEESVAESMESIKEMAEDVLKEDFGPTPSFRSCLFCSYHSICDAKMIR